MIHIFTHENLFVLNLARDRLLQEGIPSEIRNQYLSSGLGTLPAFDSWPQLWVDSECDLSVATKLLAELTTPTDAEHSDWICPQCHEENGAAFERCWHCDAPPSL